MFKVALLSLMLLFTIFPSNSIDINMHIKANGVGHKTHDINLDYNYLVFKDTGRGDVVLQKENRELYLNNGLYHKMDLNLVSLEKNSAALWRDTECIQNYEVGASVHMSYKDVTKLDASELLKTDNKTLLHDLSTKFSGEMNMDVNVVNTTSKHSIFESHETLIGHFEIEREAFVR